MSAVLLGAGLNAAGAAANIVDQQTTVEELAGLQGKKVMMIGTPLQAKQALIAYLTRTLPYSVPTQRPSHDSVIIQQVGNVRIRPASLDPGANYAGHDTVFDNGRGIINTGRKWGL